MKTHAKKLIRTVLTNFPFLLELKFALMRRLWKTLHVPFERDFDALSLFPKQKDALYLDVGANRGQSTDAILLRTTGSLVQQFEPNPTLCRMLVHMFGNNPRITTNAFGLGDVAGDRPLYVPFYKEWMFDPLASFDLPSAKDWLKQGVYFYRDQHLSLRQTICRMRTLDELNLRPFMIKLDIQGYEFQALKGAEQTLRACEPVLLIESPPTESIKSFLQDLGYSMYAFVAGEFVPGAVGYQNTYFMTRAKSELVKAHIRN